MPNALIIIFFSLVFLIFYTYLIYPLVLMFLVSFKKKYAFSKEISAENQYPNVSMIVAAYNEEKVMEEKIKNFMSINYPRDKIELIVGSDGSKDSTESIIKDFENERIRLRSFGMQRGKISVLNDIVKESRGEIIIFSDADTMFAANAALLLVKHFKNKKIGAVCGRLKLKSVKSSLKEEKRYWNYENFIKEKESALKSIVSINGQIFAIRKELFYPFPKDTITEDQVLGMHIIKQGYDIKFEPKAAAFEMVGDLKKEINRRIRISAGNFQSIKYYYRLLAPAAGFISFALWSHKILRWLAPFFGLSIFILTPIAARYNRMYILLFFAQILFYLIIPAFYLLFGFLRKNKILSIIFYFDIMNAAVIIGFFKFLSGTQKSAWKS